MSRSRRRTTASLALALVLAGATGCSDLDSVLGDNSMDSPERIDAFEAFLDNDFAADFKPNVDPSSDYECVQGKDQWASVERHPEKVAIRMVLGPGSCPRIGDSEDAVMYIVRPAQKPKGSFTASLEVGPEPYAALEPNVARAFGAVVRAAAQK